MSSRPAQKPWMAAARSARPIEQAGGNIEIRIPDKIAAVKELTRMCGWAKPDRVELSATDTLADFINSIRQSEKPEGLTHEGLPHVKGNGLPQMKTTGTHAIVMSQSLERLIRSQFNVLTWDSLKEPAKNDADRLYVRRAVFPHGDHRLVETDHGRSKEIVGSEAVAAGVRMRRQRSRSLPRHLLFAFSRVFQR